MKSLPRTAEQSLSSDDVIFLCKPIDRPHGTAAMMVTPPAIGVIPVLFTNAVIGLFPGRLDGGDVLRLQPSFLSWEYENA